MFPRALNHYLNYTRVVIYKIGQRDDPGLLWSKTRTRDKHTKQIKHILGFWKAMKCKENKPLILYMLVFHLASFLSCKKKKKKKDK